MRIFSAILVVLAFAIAQIFIGGAKMVYSIPAYTLLSISALVALAPGWRAPRTVNGLCILSTLAWFGYLIIRNRISPVEYLARSDFFILLGALLVYLLTTVLLNETKQRVVVFSGLLLLCIAHVVVGAVQFKEVNQYNPIPWIKRLDQTWRASGFYISPNHYAGMVECVGLMAIAMTFWSRWKLPAKIFTGYGAVVCAVGVAISGSRGGYLSFTSGAAVLVLIALYLNRKTNPRRFWISTVVVLTLFAAGLGVGLKLMFRSPELRERVSQINDPGNMRLFMWAAAMKQHALSPWIGTGSGTYLFYGRHYRERSVQNDPIYVHNDYIHLLAEYGNVGAALFLIFFAIHANAGFRALARLSNRAIDSGQPQSNALAFNVGAIAAVGAYVIHSIVDFNLHIPANALMMGFMFGMIANPGIQVGSVSTWPAHLVRWTLPVVAIAFLSFGPRKWPSEYYGEQARMALRDKEWGRCIELAHKAIETEKANNDLYYYLGEALRSQALETPGDHESLTQESIAEFEKGLKIFPQDVRIVVKLAAAHDVLGEFDAADNYLGEAEELDPHLSSVYAYYGLHFRAQNRLDDAKIQFQKALALDPTQEVAKAGIKEVEETIEALKRRIRDAGMRGEDIESAKESDASQ